MHLLGLPGYLPVLQDRLREDTGFGVRSLTTHSACRVSDYRVRSVAARSYLDLSLMGLLHKYQRPSLTGETWLGKR